MSLKVRLADAFGNILGASWFAPIRTSFFGEGAGNYHSPVSFTAQAKSGGRIYLTGVAPTITDGSQFRSVKTYSPSGALIGEYYPCTQTPFHWDSLSSILTIAGVEFGNVASVDVELHGEHRAYSATEDAIQSYSVNPEHAWTQQSTLADVTDGTDGTYYYYVDFDMYRYGGFQLDMDCDAVTVTATLEASFQDDGTAQATCAYQDVTNDLFGVASLVAAAAPATDMWVIDTPFPAKYLRIKIVAATGGNTGDWTIYFRGTY